MGESGESFDIAVPKEYQGPGGATNPEELLTSAVGACYTITFGIIAGNRRLVFENLSVAAQGEVDQQGANLTFKKITVRPTITLPADASDAQVALANDIAHKADLYCIITNAVRDKVEVVIEPTVNRG